MDRPHPATMQTQRSEDADDSALHERLDRQQDAEIALADAQLASLLAKQRQLAALRAKLASLRTAKDEISSLLSQTSAFSAQVAALREVDAASASVAAAADVATRDTVSESADAVPRALQAEIEARLSVLSESSVDDLPASNAPTAAVAAEAAHASVVPAQPRSSVSSVPGSALANPSLQNNNDSHEKIDHDDEDEDDAQDGPFSDAAFLHAVSSPEFERLLATAQQKQDELIALEQELTNLRQMRDEMEQRQRLVEAEAARRGLDLTTSQPASDVRNNLDLDILKNDNNQDQEEGEEEEKDEEDKDDDDDPFKEHRQLLKTLRDMTRELDELENRQQSLRERRTSVTDSKESKSAADLQDADQNETDESIEQLMARLVAASVKDQVAKHWQSSNTLEPTVQITEIVDQEDFAALSSSVESVSGTIPDAQFEDQSVSGAAHRSETSKPDADENVQDQTIDMETPESSSDLSHDHAKLLELKESLRESMDKVQSGIAQVLLQFNELVEARRIVTSDLKRKHIDMMVDKLIAQLGELREAENRLKMFGEQLDTLVATAPVGGVQQSPVPMPRTTPAPKPHSHPFVSNEGAGDNNGTESSQDGVQNGERVVASHLVKIETRDQLERQTPRPDTSGEFWKNTTNDVSLSSLGRRIDRPGMSEEAARAIVEDLDKSSLGQLDQLMDMMASASISKELDCDVDTDLFDDEDGNKENEGDDITEDEEEEEVEDDEEEEEDHDSTSSADSNVRKLFLKHKSKIYRSAASMITKFEETPYFLLSVFKRLGKLTTTYSRERLLIALDEIADEVDAGEKKQAKMRIKDSASASSGSPFLTPKKQRLSASASVQSSAKKNTVTNGFGRNVSASISDAVAASPVRVDRTPRSKAWTGLSQTSSMSSQSASKSVNKRVPLTETSVGSAGAMTTASVSLSTPRDGAIKSIVPETPLTTSTAKVLRQLAQKSMQLHLKEIFDDARIVDAPESDKDVITPDVIQELVLQISSMMYAHLSFEDTLYKKRIRDAQRDAKRVVGLDDEEEDDDDDDGMDVEAMEIVDSLRPAVVGVMNRYSGASISMNRQAIESDISRLLDVVFGPLEDDDEQQSDAKIALMAKSDSGSRVVVEDLEQDDKVAWRAVRNTAEQGVAIGSAQHELMVSEEDMSEEEEFEEDEEEAEGEIFEAATEVIEQQARINEVLDDMIRKNHVASTYTELESPRKVPAKNDDFGHSTFGHAASGVRGLPTTRPGTSSVPLSPASRAILLRKATTHSSLSASMTPSKTGLRGGDRMRNLAGGSFASMLVETLSENDFEVDGSAGADGLIVVENKMSSMSGSDSDSSVTIRPT